MEQISFDFSAPARTLAAQNVVAILADTSAHIDESVPHAPRPFPSPILSLASAAMPAAPDTPPLPASLAWQSELPNFAEALDFIDAAPELTPIERVKTVIRHLRERGAAKRSSYVEGVIGAIWNRSGRKFDKPFATHRFRHAIGTHAPADDPEHPGLATSLLAISGAMHQKHYNRAQDHIAETRFNENLREERAKNLILARRLLAERRNG